MEANEELSMMDELNLNKNQIIIMNIFVVFVIVICQNSNYVFRNATDSIRTTIFAKKKA